MGICLWLPENDLVYFILDTVNELDISAITAKYEQQERGFPPYNPQMMVALLFYASYATDFLRKNSNVSAVKSISACRPKVKATKE